MLETLRAGQMALVCVCDCSLRLCVSPSGRSLLPLAASHPDLREDLCLSSSSSLFSGTRAPRQHQALCGGAGQPSLKMSVRGSILL